METAVSQRFVIFATDKKVSINMEKKDLIKFLDWKGSYALFEIQVGQLPDGCILHEIIVAHEGNWIAENSMDCHREYAKYEDVQSALDYCK